MLGTILLIVLILALLGACPLGDTVAAGVIIQAADLD
jgi:hypothetical protein